MKIHNDILKSISILGFGIISIFSQAQNIELWESRGNKSMLLKKVQPTILTGDVSVDVSIVMNPDKQYQSYEGVGASLTHSSAYIMNKYLSKEAREKLLKDLFTKEGIGIDYLRLTVGASDFSPEGNFTYDDTPGDTELKDFSLKRDENYFLPVLSEIVSVNKEIKLLGSPWSPPAWMKTNNSMVSGQLKKEYYQTYSDYFVKYITEMGKKGFNIQALTIQNEPLHDKAEYPCMLMTAEEQRDFIKNNFGPTLRKNNLDTEILAYDHNWDRPDYGITILKDPEAAKYITGTAFHAYGGSVDAMTKVHNVNPSKGIYFTEQSGGGWAPNYSDNLHWMTSVLMADGFRNWTKNVLLWNLALDDKSGPTNKGCKDCRGVITVFPDGHVDKNEEYYALGHIGKFVKTGARRIDTNDTSDKNLKNVAFINPDGEIVMLMVNSTSKSRKVSVLSGFNLIKLKLDPDSINTFIFK